MLVRGGGEDPPHLQCSLGQTSFSFVVKSTSYRLVGRLGVFVTEQKDISHESFNGRVTTPIEKIDHARHIHHLSLQVEGWPSPGTTGLS